MVILLSAIGRHNNIFSGRFFVFCNFFARASSGLRKWTNSFCFLGLKASLFLAGTTAILISSQLAMEVVFTKYHLDSTTLTNFDAAEL